LVAIIDTPDIGCGQVAVGVGSAHGDCLKHNLFVQTIQAQFDTFLFSRYGGRMGRPRTFEQSERMTVWMEKSDFDQLREIASQEDRPYSDIVRDLIQRYIKHWRSKRKSQ
jgi:hypothetical protein